MIWLKYRTTWELQIDGRIVANVYVNNRICATQYSWRKGPEFRSVPAAKRWCEEQVTINQKDNSNDQFGQTAEPIHSAGGAGETH